MKDEEGRSRGGAGVAEGGRRGERETRQSARGGNQREKDKEKEKEKEED